MRPTSVALALLSFMGAEALQVATPLADNYHCKVACKGWHTRLSLGMDFAKMDNPERCCQKCDEVYKVSPLLNLHAVSEAQGKSS